MSPEDYDDPGSRVFSDTGPFAIVPRWVMGLRHPEGKRISAGAVEIYIALGFYADQEGLAWPKRSTLARDLDVSTKTVDRALAELESLGAVEVIPRFEEVDGVRLQRSNWYKLRRIRPEEMPGRAGATDLTPGGGQEVGGATDLTPPPATDLSPQELEPDELDPITPPTPPKPLSGPVANALPPLMRSEAAVRSVPAARHRAAGWVLDNAHRPDEPKLTATERRALRQPVDEWIGAGYDPERIAQAIAASPYKTAAAVGGELRGGRSSPSRRSVGDDAVAAAMNFISGGESHES